MASFNNNKRAVESILVAYANEPMVNEVAVGGALPGGGVRLADGLPLMNVTNPGRVNLLPGQLGVFAYGIEGSIQNNMAIAANTSAVQTPQVQVVVGTPTSQTPGRSIQPMVNNEPYVSSGQIDGRYPIIASVKSAELHTYSIVRVGDEVGNAGEINILDTTEYSVRVAYRGQVLDTENSMHAYASSSYTYVTPDYTTLGTAEPLDHFVQNMVHVINIQSREFYGASNNWGSRTPLIALAIGTVAAGAQNIAALNPGDALNVFVDRNGNQRSITLTTEMLRSLQASIPAGLGVINVNRQTAGINPLAQYFLLVGLDRELVWDDRVKNVKIRIEAGLPRGFFNTVDVVTESLATEGQGLGRQWVLFYENTAGQRKYSQFQRQDWPFIEVPSGINPAEYYDVVVIEHMTQKQIGVASVSVSPKKTIILFPICNTVAKASFANTFRNWLLGSTAFSGVNMAANGSLPNVVSGSASDEFCN